MVEESKTNPSSQSKANETGATRAWAERWLSQKRLAPYLAACGGGNVERALDLYEQNISLGQALMRDAAHFEVALRNAYDRMMGEHWGGSHWLFDDDSPALRPIVRMSKNGSPRDVNLVNRRAVAQALSNAHDKDDPDQVIANLMFGFWAHLTDRNRKRDLQIPYLNAAWPKGTDRNGLNNALAAINRLRNRAACNERLFDLLTEALSPAGADANIIRALRALCPEAAGRLYGDERRSPVELFCEGHPAPANVRL